MKNTAIALLAFAMLALMPACTNEQDNRRDAIAGLEAQAEGADDATTAKILIEAYQDYAAAYPQDTEYTPRYMYREASLRYRLGDFQAAAGQLRQLLANYPQNPAAPQAMLLLGDLYLTELQQPAAGRMALQALVTTYPDSPAATEAKGRIDPSTPEMDTALEKLRFEIYSDSLMRLDYRKASQYIELAELYSTLLPESETAPLLLYRAGEVARSTRNFEKALSLYQRLGEQFPEHEKAPQALFMQAFTLDNDLRRFEEAGALYEQFITQYPEDDFAESAQVLLDNLGKDEEEIIRNLNAGAVDTTEAAVQ